MGWCLGMPGLLEMDEGLVYNGDFYHCLAY